MIVTWLLIAIGTISLVDLATSQAVMKFEKCYCIVHDPTTVQNVNCLAKAINRTTVLINMHGNIVRQVENVFISIEMFKKAEIKYRPFLINVTESYCDFFGKNRAGKYLRIISSIYLPYTNLNHTCPYFGHVYIKDFPLDTSKVPSVWPVGQYRMDVTSFEPNRKIITMTFFLEVKERPLIWKPTRGPK